MHKSPGDRERTRSAAAAAGTTHTHAYLRDLLYSGSRCARIAVRVPPPPPPPRCRRCAHVSPAAYYYWASVARAVAFAHHACVNKSICIYACVCVRIYWFVNMRARSFDFQEFRGRIRGACIAFFFFFRKPRRRWFSGFECRVRVDLGLFEENDEEKKVRCCG